MLRAGHENHSRSRQSGHSKPEINADERGYLLGNMQLVLCPACGSVHFFCRVNYTYRPELIGGVALDDVRREVDDLAGCEPIDARAGDGQD